MKIVIIRWRIIARISISGSNGDDDSERTTTTMAAAVENQTERTLHFAAAAAVNAFWLVRVCLFRSLALCAPAPGHSANGSLCVCVFVLRCCDSWPTNLFLVRSVRWITLRPILMHKSQWGALAGAPSLLPICMANRSLGIFGRKTRNIKAFRDFVLSLFALIFVTFGYICTEILKIGPIFNWRYTHAITIRLMLAVWDHSEKTHPLKLR